MTKFFFPLSIGIIFFFVIFTSLFFGQDNPSSFFINLERVIAPSPIIKEQAILVSKVIDGDTIQTKEGLKIRYIGINSPETGEPKSKQAYELNKYLVLNKEIILEFDVQKRDRYGRLLAYVFVDESSNSNYKTRTFINQEMVKKGFAVSETIQPNVKYQEKILIAQKEARRSCNGIWEELCAYKLKDGSNCIKIVLINADSKGNGNMDNNGEWIEIENTCSNSISMNNWFLKDSSASNKYKFKDFIINGNKKVILYSGCGPDSKEKLFWICPEGKYSIWNNSGDHGFLYNEKGELVSDYQY